MEVLQGREEKVYFFVAGIQGRMKIRKEEIE